MKTKDAINKIEKRISNGTYDFLVNKYDAEFSIVHIVDTVKDIDCELNGWHLWVIKDCDKEIAFVQTVNNEYGFDHHHLTYDEQTMFLEFFLGDAYHINKIK